MRLRGLLLPSNWNEDGHVTDLVLATSDEAEFPLKSDRPPEQLKRYFRKKVIIDGDLATTGLFKVKAIGFYEVELEPVGEDEK